MFGNSDTKKNSEFVGKVQAARQQRAEEKEREKAAICVQVNFHFLFMRLTKMYHLYHLLLNHVTFDR